VNIVEESGWYAASRSAIEHYVPVKRGALRIKRRALCGRESITWGEGPEKAARCLECADMKAAGYEAWRP
jgi:hypothetical protein